MSEYIEKDFLCNNTDTVVTTASGRIKGYRFNGINTFLGVPYARADRFHAPVAVEPWSDIRDALGYGWTAPLLTQKTPWQNIINPNRQYPQSEDCQNLNIWTPTLEKRAHKPVVVWLHGGGFASGSSVELLAYDGTNMAKYGDVVCVSVNHRLNVFGYLDLSSFSDRYENSGNCGHADLVAALEWIRDNIACFGGDPHCVTVIGQSGGGGKVSTLMQIPAANGLFSRAVIMSGAAIQQRAPRRDREIVLGVLDELSLTPNDIDQLCSVAASSLIRAVRKTVDRLYPQSPGNPKSMITQMIWEPTANDWFLGEPVIHGFSEHARQIPVLVGTVLGEFSIRAAMSNKKSAGKTAKYEYLRRIYGSHTDELVSLFRQAYPERDYVDLAATDSTFRALTIAYCDRRAAECSAPTFAYLNNTEMPLDDGIPLWHCGDIDFFFHNTEYSPLHQIPGVTSRLEEEIFGAFMQFVRTGNPNKAGTTLPQWPSYTQSQPYTMLFSAESRVRQNHDRALIAGIDRYRTVFSPVDF